MNSLQPAHDEMAARHRLEMIGEDCVDRGAADRSENRHRLGGELLADGYAESRGDLADQPHHHRGRLPRYALLQDETGALADQSRKRGANGEIAALDRCVVPGVTAERENLEAGERGLGAAKSSPCSRAISAIDRNSIVVDIGNSTARAPMPSAPPMAPEAAAAALVQTVRGLASRF